MTKNYKCSCTEETTEEELYTILDEVIEDYRSKAGALIPVLQITQNLFGYLPAEAIKRIAVKLGKSYSEVAGVISFYSFFSRYPRGKYVVRVCLGTACYVRGGKTVLESFNRHLKIDVGQTTPDRLFSLDVGRCFGACGLAPVIMINDTVHQRVKPEKVGEIVSYYKALEKQAKKEVLV
jgi:NADH:ubiquinone oxidoreductase subunit E